jgi:hypothetical protein
MKGPPTREFSKPTSAENCRTDDNFDGFAISGLVRGIYNEQADS